MLAFLETAAMDDPLWLVLLILPAVALLLRWVRKDGVHRALPHPALAWIPANRGIHAHMSRVQILLRAAALMCLVPIIAGAGSAAVDARARKADIALMLAIDVSSSMSAEDFAPGNRLAQARHRLEEFVGGLPGVSVGIVRFAAVPELLVPLTRDKGAVLSALARIEPAGYGEDGTAIGSAIASAANRLHGSSADSRSIILLTDGVNNRGSVSPADAARIARSLGLSLNIIGIGTGQVTRFWIPAEQGTAQAVEARIEIDDQNLEELCTIAGGRYQRVRNPEELGQALEALQTPAVTAPPLTGERAQSSVILLLAWLALGLLTIEFASNAFLFPETPG